jgi:23S rRNA (cytosine1962-C5)-methyltransferase
MKILRLKPGKERSLLRRHPWVFDGAIAKGGGDTGETVRVESHEGQFLAWAAYSPASKIRARAWSFDEAQRVDAAFFKALCEASVRARARFAIPSDAMRLVHGESDGLPGLIVDRYGDTLVAQFLSAGAEKWKNQLADALLAATGLAKLYERSDASSRALEGLPEVKGWLRGTGDTELVLTENSWKLALSIAEGHKTGFYLDQRDSRQRFFEATQRLQFKTVLNCFSYTGGFTVAALAGMRAAGVTTGHVTSIDSSAPALQKAAHNLALNGFDPAQATFIDADVNASLRQYLDPSLRPLSRMLSVQLALTKTSTAWPSSCSLRVACCSPFPARAGSAPTCSTKLLPGRALTPGWTATSPNAWAARQTIR